MLKDMKLIVVLLFSFTIFQFPVYSQFLSTCTDSDQGNNINQAGTLTLSSLFRTVTKKDFCSSGQLIEYFCRDNKIGFEIKTCPSKTNCYQGACVGGSGQPTQSLPQLPPQNPPEVICPAVCKQMYLLEQNQCRFTDCGSGCGPNSINSFPTLEECQQRITNPPSLPPPQQPRTNYPNPPSFYISPDYIGYYAYELNGKSMALKSKDYPDFQFLDMSNLASYIYPNYRYTIIDYNKDGLDDFSAISAGTNTGGRFHLFKGVAKSKLIEQDLGRVGVINSERIGGCHVELSSYFLWKDIDNDGYLDLVRNSFCVGGGVQESVNLYWNNKDGTFSERVSTQRGAPRIETNSQFEDINGDNLPDLINDLDIYFNDGERGFTAGKATGLSQTGPPLLLWVNYGIIWKMIVGPKNGVVIVDIDKDSDNDLIFSIEGGLNVAQNDGLGNFQTYNIGTVTTGTRPKIKRGDGSEYEFSPPLIGVQTVRAVDFDGDGDKDIYLGPVGVIYENKVIP